MASEQFTKPVIITGLPFPQSLRMGAEFHFRLELTSLHYNEAPRFVILALPAQHSYSGLLRWFRVGMGTYRAEAFTHVPIPTIAPLALHGSGQASE